MILHTVNKSPFTSSVLQECLEVVGPQHSILLIEDGVYGAITANPLAEKIKACINTHSCRFYVLQDDLKARGFDNDRLMAELTPISYGEFVNLATQHKNVQSWF